MDLATYTPPQATMRQALPLRPLGTLWPSSVRTWMGASPWLAA